MWVFFYIANNNARYCGGGSSSSSSSSSSLIIICPVCIFHCWCSSSCFFFCSLPLFLQFEKIIDDSSVDNEDYIEGNGQLAIISSVHENLLLIWDFLLKYYLGKYYAKKLDQYVVCPQWSPAVFIKIWTTGLVARFTCTGTRKETEVY